MMRRLAALCLLTGLLLPAVATAGSPIGESRRIGVGVAAGSITTGPSVKFYYGSRRALQTVLGVSLDGIHSVSLDGVWEFGPAMRDFPGRFFVGVGPGVGLRWVGDGLGGSTTLATISLVAEVGFHFRVVPLELTLGWRPTWSTNQTGRSVTANYGSGGIRWYF